MFFEIYSKLTSDIPSECDRLFGKPVNSKNSLWLSVDSDGYPSLLFSARRADSRNDIELRSISVWFSRDCVIETAEGRRESDVYTVVRLKNNDPDIIRVLLRLLEETFRQRDKLYDNREIASRMSELADLFRQISDSAHDVVGLWGELYILSRSSDLTTAVKCWCRQKNAKYDYVADRFALEAKTTSLPKRRHRFSLEQLRPVGKFDVYVASLILVELSSGKCASELIDELYRKISDEDLRAQFFMQCLLKGGQDIYRNTLKLSVLPRQASLLIFNSSNIPVPKVEVGAPIDNVRFDVDLGDIAPIPSAEIDEILRFR